MINNNQTRPQLLEDIMEDHTRLDAQDIANDSIEGETFLRRLKHGPQKLDTSADVEAAASAISSDLARDIRSRQ